MYEPNRVYEVTVRTLQGRYLLRPSPEANDLIAGIIGRAQVLYPEVLVYLVVTLSNHIHWLVSSPAPERLPQFMGWVNGRISFELGRLYDWPGRMWEKPAEPVPILDNAAMVGKFRYLLEQGCKEGLVYSPHDWPGLTCVHALTNQEQLSGRWLDRVEAGKARRRGEKIGRCDYTTTYEVKLSRLPCWRSLSDEDHRRTVVEMVEEIEAKTREKYPPDTNPVLGVEAILRMHPHHRPEEIPKSPAPLCHTTNPRKRSQYRVRYRSFAYAFREAATRVADGIRDVVFPLFSFPPRRPMVLASGQHSPASTTNTSARAPSSSPAAQVRLPSSTPGTGSAFTGKNGL
jgi:REP element-mobilizing transposase RayT